MNDYNFDVERIEKALNQYRFQQKSMYILQFGPLAFSMLCWGIYILLDELDIYKDKNHILAIIFGIMLVASVICCFFFLWKSIHTSMDYETYYKTMMAEPILKATFDNASFNEHDGFTFQQLLDAHIIKPHGDNCYTTAQDMITGSYKGISFQQSDISMYRKRENHHGEIQLDEEIFDGRFTKFELPFRIPNRILIAKRGMHHLLYDDDPKVQLEDIEFNNLFDVHCSDPHTAFYLLTPQFMEHLKQLKNQQFWQYYSFDGNTLYYLRSGKGGIFSLTSQKTSVKEEIKKIQADLDEITDMIDILKLKM